MLGDMTREGEAHAHVGANHVAQDPFQRKHNFGQHDQRSGKLDAFHGDPFQEAHGIGTAGQAGCRHFAEKLVD